MNKIDLTSIARDDLQRLAREQIGRGLSEQECFAVSQSLRLGASASDAFTLLHQLHHGHP